jgi:hypothetical protein
MSIPIVGPVPPYTNPPIQPLNYQPRRFVISNVTLGSTTTVTTTLDMDYVIGQLVRLIIPPSYGCRQLNESQGYVISIPFANQVVLDIYSTGGDPYIASSATTQAQILGIGDINSGQVNTNGRVNQLNYIPGSFINIS